MRWLAALLAATSLGLGGCTNPVFFTSDNPSGNIGAAEPSGGDEAGNGLGSPFSTEDEAEHTIAEADIVQVKDGKLYALSQYAGITVIDVSVKGHPSVLGRHALRGIPVEMYLRDGTVYALFVDWIHDISDPATKRAHWVYSSHIEALDVSNPTAIHTLSVFDLPGDISDARLVGDVLYAVSYENGLCWGCKGMQTTVTSIAVGNPASIHTIDQLAVGAASSHFNVTSQRIYMTGVPGGASIEGHSTIQVVDIADPTGHLTRGASVEAKGLITSRWHMDEYNGVLRVVSQIGASPWSGRPAVETFTVTSSQDVQPLGYMDLMLSNPLISVRFDGTRAFAATDDVSKPKDPIFILDLADPAHPQMIGGIANPGGWTYRIEPRGDRLITLGYDNKDPEGIINVSLFDIADLTSPTLLKRVAFNKTFSDTGELYDTRKMFTILPDQGLILVPYSGFRNDDAPCSAIESAVQLIDYSDTSLTKRGVALSHGQIERAFVHDDRLFAVSEDDARSFDITDRSTPAKTTSLTLVPEVDQVIVASDKVVRVSSDPLAVQAKLEVVSASAPGSAAPIGSLDITSLTYRHLDNHSCSYEGRYGLRLFAHGTDVYIVSPSGEHDGEQSTITVISIADPAHPMITGQITVDARLDANDVNDGGSGRTTIAPGDSVVQAGSTLVFRRANPISSLQLSKEWLEVIDLADHTHPVHAATVELPEGLGHTPLRIDGTTVLTSHWVWASAESSRVSFYLDRIDVASPSAPDILAPVNMPGSLVTFNASSGRLLTVDYKRLPPEMLTSGECVKKYGSVGLFEPVNSNRQGSDQIGYCQIVERSWKLLDVSGSHASLLDTRDFVNDRVEISDVLVGDDRVFTFASHMNSNASAVATVEILGGLADGHLAGAAISDHSLDSSSPVAVAGKRLLLGSSFLPAFSALDATNLASMSIEKKAEIGGTPVSNGYAPYNVVVNGDEALCSLGRHGLEVVDLAH